MRHFGEQNEPFRDVRWLILKIGMKNSTVLFGSFTISEAFLSLE
jgi:hypothetical protein